MDETHDKKISTGQMLLGAALFILAFLFATWISTWAWNGSMPRMFSGTQSVTYGTMFSFLILLLVVGGFLCRPSLMVVQKKK